MEGGVWGVKTDHHSGGGRVDGARQLGEGSQQVAHVVAVVVVDNETVEQPFLGVVGTDLYAVNDGFGFAVG